jgi:plasmid maintenance system antidote protein VapI
MNRIKEVLKERDVSQTCLAQKRDKRKDTINEFSSNMKQLIIEDLYRIAKILDGDAKYLLKEL